MQKLSSRNHKIIKRIGRENIRVDRSDAQTKRAVPYAKVTFSRDVSKSRGTKNSLHIICASERFVETREKNPSQIPRPELHFGILVFCVDLWQNKWFKNPWPVSRTVKRP